MARFSLKPEETGTVVALNSDGQGVVRNGKTAFVTGALPGEQIRYLRAKLHRGHDDAHLLQVVEPSVERVKPLCPHFGICGGCVLQHFEHAAQLRSKDQELRDALQRVAKVEPRQFLPPLQGNVWGYRRRARLGVRYVPSRQRALVGFRERLGSFIAALDRCEVLVPEVGGLLVALSDVVTRLSIRARLPQIEVAAADNVLVLVLRILDPLTIEDREVLTQFETDHALRFFLQATTADAIEPLNGAAPTLWYELPEFDVRLEFLPSDFIQVNGPMNRQLVSRVVELLDLDADSRVLDLFCGLGNFTLPIARRAAEVVGLEGDAGLVQRARHNAALNALPNARFHAGNLAGEGAGELALQLAGSGRFSHVLLDPPRTGARDVLESIARLAPRRIVYVSCHPGSLARDLGLLTQELGFTLAAAGIVDMFPHTNHVESVAVLDGPGSRT